MLKDLDTVARNAIKEELASLDPLLRNISLPDDGPGGTKTVYEFEGIRLGSPAKSLQGLSCDSPLTLFLGSSAQSIHDSGYYVDGCRGHHDYNLRSSMAAFR